MHDVFLSLFCNVLKITRAIPKDHELDLNMIAANRETSLNIKRDFVFYRYIH